jgi:hypothetical protein
MADVRIRDITHCGETVDEGFEFVRVVGVSDAFCHLVSLTV